LKRSRLSLLALSLCATAAVADHEITDSARQPERSPGATYLQGGYARQFDADLDGGGDFYVDRLFFEGGVRFGVPSVGRLILSFAYGFDGYDFVGNSGLAAMKPWQDIHSLRLSVPIRTNLGEDWSVVLVPTLRYAGERGVSIGDGLYGGALAGLSYKVNDRLRIGPGVGVLTRIEDDIDVFPFLVIHWKITDHVSLETGRGVTASAGPGLSLNWKASERWRFSLGGRLERLRFRLDDRGVAPGGVGEERSLPLALVATYKTGAQSAITALAGVELDGELRLDDANGDLINKDEYKKAVFLALAFRASF